MTNIASFRLFPELLRIRAQLISLPASPTGVATRFRLLRRLIEIGELLGRKAGDGGDTPAPAPDAEDPLNQEDCRYEDVGQSRNPAARFYDFNPNRKPAQRRRENAAAIDLLKKIRSGEVNGTALTDEQKATLARYSGTGGAMVGEDGKRGSDYEYYTPKPIAQGAWQLLRELGFAGGKVLDPCGGTGIFGATAPADAAVDAVELNRTSGEINGLVNAGPGYRCVVSPFEQFATVEPDESYDAIITNVPFGDTLARGGNELLDSRYQSEPLEGYFILRGLEKLRPGGLALFITPERTVSGRGKTEVSIRRRASLMAEFVGAYRLPSDLFVTAGAETITDIVVFRKHGADAGERIAEIAEQAPGKLVDARVCWDEFVRGNYFSGEGRPFVLGEFKAADPEKRRGKFGDINRVLTDKSPVEVAKLLKKFGTGSRIDWSALDAVETAPIAYRDGDTITQAGATLVMKGGAWSVLKAVDDDAETAAIGAKLAAPLLAFDAGVTWADAVAYVEHMVRMSRSKDIPAWLRQVASDLRRAPTEGDRSRFWRCGLVALSAQQAFEYHQTEDVGMDYSAEYPKLTQAMKESAAELAALPASAGTMIRGGASLVRTMYRRKTGFSDVWLGRIRGDAVDTRTDTQRYEALKYESGEAWVPVEKARELYGDDFDPLSDPAWCLSPDGKSVALADDLFIGNFGDMLRKLEADAAKAENDQIRGKILAQIGVARSRVRRADTSRVTFNVFSPFVTMQDKVEFLRKMVDPGFGIVFTETGEPKIEYTTANYAADTVADVERKKLLRRVAVYLAHSTVTIGTAEFEDSAAAQKLLREQIRSINEQFNSWCRASHSIMARLDERANDPARMYFEQVNDKSPIPLPGWKMGTPPAGMTPHDYQFAFIRKTGREFGGINGFAVGLGKTSTALAAVLHAHNIGSKKRTAIIVPNSVLSNWRKEAGTVYEDGTMSGCLFVGLRTDRKGNATVKPSEYDTDLMSVMTGQFHTIFMTYEAWARIRLKADTIDEFEVFLRSIDAAFADSEDKKAATRAEGKTKRLSSILTSGKKPSSPYLEDMGIDSLVIDEAHAFKASAEASSFDSAKFLSLSEKSARGTDMQAKAWYIRGESPKGDGVMPLTATPITNSPLEIYSMMALAVGHQKVNDIALGCKGADEFLSLFCRVESEEDETMDGIARETRVFTGLDNVGVLRALIGSCTTIETPETAGVAIKVPDLEEAPTSVVLDPKTTGLLKVYAGAYRYAADELSRRNENRGDKAAYEAVAARFGEPDELIAHPFNLINKMTRIILDPDLDQLASIYTFPEDQVGLAAQVINDFNKLAITEERARKSPRTTEDAVVGTVTKGKGEEKLVFLKIAVRAVIDGGSIVVDTMSPTAQERFEDLADKAGLALGVNISPKLAALLENVRAEEQNPRGLNDEGEPTSLVKQIIFCDILASHRKIRRILMQHAGVAASQIAIITGAINSDPDEILEVQNGFNAHGDQNKYRFVIANEKAEVGINLQRGTQAIHHLTIGWTPDSLIQRNGRGARQGNKTASVRAYYYDADGTFDCHKRTIVSQKGSWIDSIVGAGEVDAVDIEGGMSREQLDALIESVGDGGAMTRFSESLAAKERAAREEGTRAKQVTNVRTILQAKQYLAENPTPRRLIAEKLSGLAEMLLTKGKVTARIADPKTSEAALLKNQEALARINESIALLSGEIGAACKFVSRDVVPVPHGKGFMYDRWSRAVEKSPEQFISDRLLIDGKKRPKVEDLVEILNGGMATIAEDSAIHEEWRTETDLARRMMTDAGARAASLAEQSGAIPVAVIDAICSGRGEVFEGRPVCSGSIIRDGDGRYFVSTDPGYVAGWTIDRRTAVLLLGSMKRPLEIYLPGAADFSDAALSAARYEDAQISGGRGAFDNIHLQNLLAVHSKPIADFRESEAHVFVSPTSDALPAPYFPVILPTELSSGHGDLFAHIVGQQASVVTWVGGSAAVPSSLATGALSRDYSRALDLAGIGRQLREWSVATGKRVLISGVKLLAKALNGIEYDHGRIVRGMMDHTVEMPSLEGVESREDVHRLVANYVRSALGALDLADAYASDEALADAASILTAQYMLDAAMRRAFASLERRKAAAAVTPPATAPAPSAVPAAAPAVAPAPVVSPDDVVGAISAADDPNKPALHEDTVVALVGRINPMATKGYRDTIRGIEKEKGWTARWNKDRGQWEIPYKLWLKLLELRPTAAQELHIKDKDQ
ncbi:hypothetical protein X805_24140 [Sphaerotilus natans subsp. natans DSM 6575]|uniref:Helicase C-terminal domain-containing protein n=1 Tax=Sphaerotilus natans subsp. natans DSM 6575 TaxID=1286631 RepID=A0A059KLJ2_9BURK|nr:SNF2-related protein [Sphaerotilus natans]KDB52044.1 hypothetical protein X805_24140 [Sphaerotilus natans subsp. natans DSM 6575]